MTHQKFLCRTCGHVSDAVSDLMDATASGGSSLFGNFPPDRCCPRCGAEYPNFALMDPASEEEKLAADLELQRDKANRV